MTIAINGGFVSGNRDLNATYLKLNGNSGSFYDKFLKKKYHCETAKCTQLLCYSNVEMYLIFHPKETILFVN